METRPSRIQQKSCSTKLDQISRFDEECRRLFIRNEGAGIASTSNKLIQKELIGGTNSESTPFSDALQVISRDLFNNHNIIILKPAAVKKTRLFCFIQVHRKLKHIFGGSAIRKGPNHQLSSFFADDCICGGLDIVNPSCIIRQKVDFSYGNNDTIETFNTVSDDEEEEEEDTIIHSDGMVMKSNDAITMANETFSRMYSLDMSENTKYHEEHQSPVSVLEHVFKEDHVNNSPSSIIPLPHTTKERLKPRRLQFEDCSSKSPINDHDYISNYSRLAMTASRLSCKNPSEISSESQDLLINSSFIDEFKFLSCYSNSDPKLIFDYTNEILLKIHRSHLRLPSVKSRRCLVNEIKNLCVLPGTEETTLGQLVARDLADDRLWLINESTEDTVSDISDEIMEELVLDVILGMGEVRS